MASLLLWVRKKVQIQRLVMGEMALKTPMKKYRFFRAQFSYWFVKMSLGKDHRISDNFLFDNVISQSNFDTTLTLMELDNSKEI